MTTFSIILPVYNARRYLGKCLDSLRGQKHTNWECFCIDDGSVDDSLQILNSYAAKDSRFKVIRLGENHGVSYARNIALGKAVGSYVGFLDSDDVVSPYWLSSVLHAFAATGADMVKAEVKRGECRFEEYKSDAVEYHVCVRNDVWDLHFLRGGLTVQNFYKRQALQNVKFPVGMKVFEDGIFNLHALVNVEKATKIGYAGYWYRVSETSAFTRRNVQDLLRLIEEFELWHDRAKEKVVRYGVDLVVKQRISTYVNSVLTGLLLKADVLGSPQLKEKLPGALARLERNFALRLDDAFAMGRGRWMKRFAYRRYIDKGCLWPFLALLNLMFWNRKS